MRLRRTRRPNALPMPCTVIKASVVVNAMVSVDALGAISGDLVQRRDCAGEFKAVLADATVFEAYRQPDSEGTRGTARIPVLACGLQLRSGRVRGNLSFLIAPLPSVCVAGAVRPASPTRLVVRPIYSRVRGLRVPMAKCSKDAQLDTRASGINWEVHWSGSTSDTTPFGHWSACVSLTTRAAISLNYVLCRRGQQTPGHTKTVRRPSSAQRLRSLDLGG
jgi:hypothetical protein